MCARGWSSRSSARSVDVTSLLDSDIPRLFARWKTARGILLAVSGGPDSMALMHLAARWAQLPGTPKLFAATVDHGLRPEAAAEAELAAEAAARLGIPHATLHWRGEKPGARIQEKARDARYELLIGHAKVVGADVLMLAHHLDDQAETVLFRLLRGSGLAGLAGMRPESRREEMILARPLLDSPKQVLIELCARFGQAYAADPSNADEAYARPRLRRLLAEAARLGFPAPSWANLARRMARADAALEEAAGAALARAAEPGNGPAFRLDFRLLATEPEEISLRALGLALDPVEKRSTVRLDRLEKLHSQLRVAVAEGQPYQATLAGFRFRLGRDGVLAASPEAIRRRGTASGRARQSLGDTNSLKSLAI